MDSDNCYSNCSRLNLTTCQPIMTYDEVSIITEGESESVKDTLIIFVTVQYDSDGCYDPKEYMAVVNGGNKFQDYSDFIGYFMLLFGAFGIVGNSLSVIVLLKKEKICFNYLLVALNCFDTFHIVFAILDVVRNNHEEVYPDALLTIFPYFHYPLYR